MRSTLSERVRASETGTERMNETKREERAHKTEKTNQNKQRDNGKSNDGRERER